MAPSDLAAQAEIATLISASPRAPGILFRRVVEFEAKGGAWSN
jgi:hypothetical protein